MNNSDYLFLYREGRVREVTLNLEIQLIVSQNGSSLSRIDIYVCLSQYPTVFMSGSVTSFLQMKDLKIVEWPFLGLIILFQLFHVFFNVCSRIRRRIKLRRTVENPQRCIVHVTNSPRPSTEARNNLEPGPSTSTPVTDVEYAVVDTLQKAKNRVIRIEPVTDVKYNVHQENQIYCNITDNNGDLHEYQNTQNLNEESSEYLRPWSKASSKVEKIKNSFMNKMNHNKNDDKK